MAQQIAASGRIKVNAITARFHHIGTADPGTVQIQRWAVILFRALLDGTGIALGDDKEDGALSGHHGRYLLVEYETPGEYGTRGPFGSTPILQDLLHHLVENARDFDRSAGDFTVWLDRNETARADVDAEWEEFTTAQVVTPRLREFLGEEQYAAFLDPALTDWWSEE
ncbi:hypothetical protein [Kitasatospora viridis]|uniref:Uncharacterized protein n=1 Tax=Kitasatospora viridis TaxID=281105 RepID=A0A561SA19_9ACTN|nr:hypothetical protein [Kitasatospora viridis]TWF71722.1 hypothetical protein FHX73_1893 [Kitasatospora viridis]